MPAGGGGGGVDVNNVHTGNVEGAYVFERQTILQTVKMLTGYAGKRFVRSNTCLDQ